MKTDLYFFSNGKQKVPQNDFDNLLIDWFQLEHHILNQMLKTQVEDLINITH